ncbi:hypothetical protein DB30_04347 [Enhygromyxa salina]|uniref:Uncharacterized protein n=1 Tax=Enhygromyxa salina TaxID=215803 RepID=A0A0C2D017_9BACT|nr:hypothetical protein DB30_04347 [Enhygromyxa salina]
MLESTGCSSASRPGHRPRSEVTRRASGCGRRSPSSHGCHSRPRKWRAPHPAPGAQTRAPFEGATHADANKRPVGSERSE